MPVDRDTGIFQITAPNSTETSDSGTYDTSSIDKDITAVMSKPHQRPSSLHS